MFLSFGTILSWLLAYRYVILFPLAVVEGPIITIMAGFLASSGQMNFFIALAVVVTGDLVGDCLYYAFGRYGRTPLVLRWGRYFGITLDRLKQLENHFKRHPGKTLVAGKLAHGVGSVVLVSAGVAEMPLSIFVWYNFLGTLPKSLLLLTIGYYFGQAYVQWSHYLRTTAIVTTIIAIVAVVAYFTMKKLIEAYE